MGSNVSIPTSSEAASNWRESDKKYFPSVYRIEPKKFPRYKYPKELKDKNIYALYARTRPQRAPGHDQELLIQPDNYCCGTCPSCLPRQPCEHPGGQECLLRYSGPCTDPDADYDTGEFRWLSRKVNDRLTVLAIQDARAYDERILENASYKDTRKFVLNKQIVNVRIWPNLHQYGHNYTFTRSNTAIGMQYKGTGNADGYGVFCCEDCYLGARDEEKTLLMAGENHILQNDGWYERLVDYNDRLRECIAIRKEREACETEYIFEKYLFAEEQAGRPTIIAPPPPRPPPTSHIITLKYRVSKAKEWEKGFGCSECPNAYFDRVRGFGSAYSKSLECHVDKEHPGHNVDDFVYRRADCKVRRARTTTTKRRRDDTGDDDLAAPPAKRRKCQASASQASQLVVPQTIVPTPPFRPEVLAVIRFDDAENAFLNWSSSTPTAERLRRAYFGLIHHAGMPAIRGAAFRSTHRRQTVGEWKPSANLYSDGWW